MRMRTITAGCVAGLIGTVGAVAGYHQLAPSPGVLQSTSAAQAPVDTTVAEVVATAQRKPRIVLRLKRCARGFQLHAGTCVRTVRRTVVVEVTPPPVAAPDPIPVATAPVTVPAPASSTPPRSPSTHPQSAAPHAGGGSSDHDDHADGDEGDHDGHDDDDGSDVGDDPGSDDGSDDGDDGGGHDEGGDEPEHG